MPDIGFGEVVVIIVIALLVFGPDRLPKMAADAARTLRQVRQLAASARKDLVDAAGLEGDGEMAQTMKDLRDLDPRRAMNGVLTDDPAAGGAASAASGAAATGSTGRAGRKRRSAAGTTSPSASGQTAAQASGPAPAPAPGQEPAAGATPAAGAVGAAGAAGAGSQPASRAGDAAAPVAPPVVAPVEVDPDWT